LGFWGLAHWRVGWRFFEIFVERSGVLLGGAP
jgi:hypothetical protein